MDADNRCILKLVEIDDWHIDPDTYTNEWEGKPRCLPAALSYAEKGWHVFPAPRGEKKSHKSAEHSGGRKWGKTTDPNEIKRDFAQWPLANVGIATGSESGIWVVEADTPKGHNVDGIASLADLENRYGKLPPTLTGMSPSGSVHRFFRWPKDCVIRNTTSGIAPGVDVRGEGGMVIAPPSVRIGEGAYTWINNAPMADAPEWLVASAVAASGPSDAERTRGEQAEADPHLVAAAMMVIPNQDLDWENWNRIGLAAYRATGGRGFAAFDEWSQKSGKYDSATTVERWHHYSKHPPNQIGVGTLFHLANEAEPGWQDAYHRKVEEDYQAQLAAGHVPDEMMQAKLAAAGADGDRVSKKEILSDESEHKVEPKSDAEPEPKPDPKPKPDPEPKPQATTRKTNLLRTSAEFVADYKPPDYLIYGLLQRGYIYSFTGPTGSGKTAIALRIGAHAALGLPIADKEVEQGRVAFFAGENPDDVRTRWIKLCEQMKQDSAAMDVRFLPGAYPITENQTFTLMCQDLISDGPFSLIVIDTNSAFFSGQDENDNVQVGTHARALRKFTQLPGKPTVLVTCHPTKNYDPNNLLPRGGGAFLNEIDGNLVALKERGSMIVEVDWHGKFRGPEFEPFSFKLVAATSELIKDSKGRPMWTVYSQPASDAERAAMETAGRSQEIKALKHQPGASLRGLAEILNWRNSKDEPNRRLVQSVTDRLKKEKLVEVKRGKFVLTKKGEQEAEGSGDDEEM